MNLKDEKTKVTYHCYDCGGIWDNEGVDIYKARDLTKYICKECRGRCLPEDELNKVRGVKSIRQRFSNGRITLLLLIIVFIGVILNVYNRQVRINEYNLYLRETAALRKIINARLENYQEDYKILQNFNNAKSSPAYKKAQSRIFAARQYIAARDFEIQNINKPETLEVLDLYTAETAFWKDPSYKNYIIYQGIYNNMKNKYSKDFFELLKDKVRQQAEKSFSNKKTK